MSEHKANNSKENIRQRAYLNALTGWIDTGARLLVGFFLNPVTVSILGPVLYGVWQIIGQMNSYMVTADLRTSTALKWVVAKNRTTAKPEELRESVGAALFTNIVFLPLYLIAGAIIIYLAPHITKVNQEYFGLVRITSSILVVSFIFRQFFFLFESVLHGMNLSYKRIGVRALITIAGGFLTYIVLKLGYGMIGMALIKMLVIIITGFTFYIIVKKYVVWFGIAKVGFKKIIDFAKTSGWFMAMKIVDLLNQSVDLILLGFFAGPAFVTSYTLSRFIIQSGTNLIRGGINSVTPGLARFVAEKEFSKIIYSRKQLIALSWLVLGALGSTVNLFNNSFINLWAGDFFAGQIETFLIVLFFIQQTMLSHDSSIITMTLNIKRKIFYSLISAIVSIVLSIILIPTMKITGLLIAMNIGVLIMIISFSRASGKIVNRKNMFGEIAFSRISVTSMLLLGASCYFSTYFMVSKWLHLIPLMLLSALAFIFIIFLVGFNSENKKALIANYKKIKLLRKD